LSYLAGKTERKVFYELNARTPAYLNDALGRDRFPAQPERRLPPVCLDCRLLHLGPGRRREFQPSATQRRVMRR